MTIYTTTNRSEALSSTQQSFFSIARKPCILVPLLVGNKIISVKAAKKEEEQIKSNAKKDLEELDRQLKSLAYGQRPQEKTNSENLLLKATPGTWTLNEVSS